MESLANVRLMLRNLAVGRSASLSVCAEKCKLGRRCLRQRWLPELLQTEDLFLLCFNICKHTQKWCTSVVV